MPTFMQQVRKRTMTEAIVCLFTLEAPSRNILIRYTNNGRDVVSNGRTFTAYPFTFLLPSSGGEDLPEIRVSCSGVDDVLRAAVKTLPTESREATIMLQLVLASAPDTIVYECSAPYMQAPTTVDGIDLIAGYSQEIGDPHDKRKYDTVHYPGVHAAGVH